METTNNKILITNIQRFSIHDGPGIRTTVFFKGCSLHCPWCCNPENISNKIQAYIKDDIEGIYGKYCTVDEIYGEVIKDRVFYYGELTDYQITNSSLFNRLPGGVTFSGGECLLQMKQIKPLLLKLDREHIHMVVETCLFVPEENLDIAIKYIDMFYIDVKILNNMTCKRFLQADIDIYMKNLEKLMDATKPIVIRIPVIGGYTDGIDNRKQVCGLIEKYKTRILKVEIVKENHLGVSKYNSLIKAGNAEFDVPDYRGVSDELIEQYKTEVENIGVWVEVCKVY